MLDPGCHECTSHDTTLLWANDSDQARAPRREIDRLADAIAVSAAHIDAATHELLRAIQSVVPRKTDATA